MEGKICLSPNANGSTRSSDFFTNLLLDIRVLGEFEGGGGQRIGSGFV